MGPISSISVLFFSLKILGSRVCLPSTDKLYSVLSRILSEKKTIQKLRRLGAKKHYSELLLSGATNTTSGYMEIS